MGNVKETISKNILFYRKQKKMSQKELAKRIGVNNSAISNWENGINSIDIETLFKVCKELEVSIDTMFGNNIEITPCREIHTDSSEVSNAYENADFDTKNNVRFLLKLPLLKEEIAEELFPSVKPKLTAEDEKELEIIKQEMLVEKKGITSSASISAKDA